MKIIMGNKMACVSKYIGLINNQGKSYEETAVEDSVCGSDYAKYLGLINNQNDSCTGQTSGACPAVTEFIKYKDGGYCGNYWPENQNNGYIGWAKGCACVDRSDNANYCENLNGSTTLFTSVNESDDGCVINGTSRMLCANLSGVWNSKTLEQKAGACFGRINPTDAQVQPDFCPQPYLNAKKPPPDIGNVALNPYDPRHPCYTTYQDYCKIGTNIITEPICQQICTQPEQKGYCDTYMRTACSTDTYARADICSCINSAVPRPECFDTTCTTKGYQTADMHASLDSCQGSCVQVFNCYEAGQCNISGNTFNQYCYSQYPNGLPPPPTPTPPTTPIWWWVAIGFTILLLIVLLFLFFR